MNFGLGRPRIVAGYIRNRPAVPQRKLRPTDRRRHTNFQAGCRRAAAQSIINCRNNLLAQILRVLVPSILASNF